MELPSVHPTQGGAEGELSTIRHGMGRKASSGSWDEPTTMGVGGVPPNYHDAQQHSNNHPAREGGRIGAVFGSAPSAAIGAMARDVAFGAEARGARFDASTGCITGTGRGLPLLSTCRPFSIEYIGRPGVKKNGKTGRHTNSSQYRWLVLIMVV